MKDDEERRNEVDDASPTDAARSDDEPGEGVPHDETWHEPGPEDPEGWSDDALSDDALSDDALSARPAVLAGVFLVGLVTGLVLVLGWGALTAEDAPERAASGATASLAGAGDSEDDDAAVPPPSRTVATRLSRCSRAATALQTPLDAAQPALDQWAVHVGAMNKLVVGELTLQQATDFWNQTRVGAQRQVEGFRDAMGTLRREGVDCPAPDLLAKGARALPSCSRQVQAQVRVLHAARTSIDMWERHIHHMDMMRLGELSPEEATQMWLGMWQRGVRELDAYRLVAREAGELHGCIARG